VLLGGRRQPHAQKVRAGERALAREKSTGCGRTLVFPLLLFFPHTREAVTRRRSRELLKKLAHPGGESSAGAGGGVLLRSVPLRCRQQSPAPLLHTRILLGSQQHKKKNTQTINHV